MAVPTGPRAYTPCPCPRGFAAPVACPRTTGLAKPRPAPPVRGAAGRHASGGDIEAVIPAVPTSHSARRSLAERDSSAPRWEVAGEGRRGAVSQRRMAARRPSGNWHRPRFQPLAYRDVEVDRRPDLIVANFTRYHLVVFSEPLHHLTQKTLPAGHTRRKGRQRTFALSLAILRWPDA